MEALGEATRALGPEGLLLLGLVGVMLIASGIWVFPKIPSEFNDFLEALNRDD